MALSSDDYVMIVEGFNNSNKALQSIAKLIVANGEATRKVLNEIDKKLGTILEKKKKEMIFDNGGDE